ncbi:MAG: hypothetical protein JWM27_3363 [Gemmatimonadetes bacterium]|nr:hypothetical protein [Gemmatimonadota bacterium]
MNRKAVIAATLLALGTLAGCARSDNPVGPGSERAARSPAFNSVPATASRDGTTLTTAASDTVPPPPPGDVIWSTGGN